MERFRDPNGLQVNADQVKVIIIERASPLQRFVWILFGHVQFLWKVLTLGRN